MGTRAIKKEVLAALQQQDLEYTLRLFDDFAPKELVNALFSMICRDEPVIRWHAISCMGIAINRLTQQELEEGRMIMRRLLWSLNDESGGIGWGAPETMAEIMCSQGQLAREYKHMLISYMREDGEELHQDGNFIEHPLLQRGLLWGIGRLGACREGIMSGHLHAEDFEPYFNSPDSEVRGFAAWAAGKNRIRETKSAIKSLLKESSALTLYHAGVFTQTTVGTLASQAIKDMDR